MERTKQIPAVIDGAHTAARQKPGKERKKEVGARKRVWTVCRRHHSNANARHLCCTLFCIFTQKTGPTLVLHLFMMIHSSSLKWCRCGCGAHAELEKTGTCWPSALSRASSETRARVPVALDGAHPPPLESSHFLRLAILHTDVL